MNDHPIKKLPLARIGPPINPLRESVDIERLGELADSMAAEGLHQPIGVLDAREGEHYALIWGDRRTRAARMLAWETIDARVFPQTYDPLLAAVTENLQRTDLSPMDEARAVARFVEREQPDAAIARLFRRSPGWVSQRRQLLSLQPDLQAAVHSGTLAIASALALSQIDHDDYRQELLNEALRTGASARVVDVWRSHYEADKDRIIGNHLTIQEIAIRRDAWVIMVPCDACGRKVEYPETVSWRICTGCDADLRAAMAATPATNGTAPDTQHETRH